MLCDIYFCYDDESMPRPFIFNCPLNDVGFHAQRIADKACVSQIFVDIKPDNPVLEFFEFTL